MRCPMLRRDYEIFEKFPNGATVSRAHVNGWYKAQRKFHELVEHSTNEFFAVDSATKKVLSFSSKLSKGAHG